MSPVSFLHTYILNVEVLVFRVGFPATLPHLFPISSSKCRVSISSFGGLGPRSVFDGLGPRSVFDMLVGLFLSHLLPPLV